MKKGFILVVLALSAAACNQQGQQYKGQAAYPGAGMRTPAEIRQIEQIAKQAPKNPGGWIMLGNVLMDASRYAEAIDAYQKALALDPKNVDVRVDMGTCYRNSGNPKRAIGEYRKALRRAPNHINANRNIGVVLAYDLNDKKGAAKAFEKYLQLAPFAPDAEQIRQLIETLKAGQ